MEGSRVIQVSYLAKREQRPKGKPTETHPRATSPCRVDDGPGGSFLQLNGELQLHFAEESVHQVMASLSGNPADHLALVANQHFQVFLPLDLQILHNNELPAWTLFPKGCSLRHRVGHFLWQMLKELLPDEVGTDLLR